MKMHRSGNRVPGAAFGSQGHELGFLYVPNISDFPLDRGRLVSL